VSAVLRRRILLTLAIAATTLLALWPPLYAAGEARLDAMAGRALATFAATRALNGVISVVQGTEVALQPAGVGVTLSVGELLDPLNDLVERFSWLMLAATAALGVQAVLLDAASAPALSLALALLAALCTLRTWWPLLGRSDGNAWLPRLLILLLFVRLCVPLTALGAHAFSERWLEPRREAAVAVLETTREAIDRIETAPPTGDRSEEGWIDSLRRYPDDQRERLDLDARLKALGDRIDLASERVIDLVVVFLLQTLLVPLALVWLLWRLTLALLGDAMRPQGGMP
jgi:hypothetical protein